MSATKHDSDALLAALKRLVDQVGETPSRPHDRDFSQAYSAAYDLVYGADEFTERFMEQATNK